MIHSKSGVRLSRVLKPRKLRNSQYLHTEMHRH